MDTNVWLPPLIALVCTICGGLTSFGDAILYHVVWAALSTSGVLNFAPRESLTRSILYLSILPIASLPLGLYVARRELWPCFLYGAVMAASGMCAVPLGIYLQLNADVQLLKGAVGIVFLVFALFRLTASILELGRQRRAARGAREAALAARGGESAAQGGGASSAKGSGGGGDDAAAAEDEAPSTALSRDAAARSIDAAPLVDERGAVALALSRSLAPESGRAASAREAAPLSPRDLLLVQPRSQSPQRDAPLQAGEPLASTVAAPVPVRPSPEPQERRDACERRAAGDGQLAAKPPPAAAPQSAAAPAFLSAALVRAAAGRSPCCPPPLVPISAIYSIRATLLLLLATGAFAGLLGGAFGTAGPPMMIAFALLRLDMDIIRGVAVVYGALELGLRIALLVTSRGSAFDAAEMPIYAAVAAASCAGFLAGTALRRFVDTALVVRLLLVLVLASSALLLGALESAGVAAAFGIAAALWLALLAAAWRNPARADAAGAALKAAPRAACTRARAACCPLSAAPVVTPSPS